MNKGLILLIAILILPGCASKSHFSALQDDAKITVGKTAISGDMPLEGEVGRTTFGKYPVKVSKSGCEPLYFNLPLKVSPGYIVIDALFFAPAAFFNVQGSLPFYEIDMESRIVKYRQSSDSEWVVYTPTQDQVFAAKRFFGD